MRNIPSSDFVSDERLIPSQTQAILNVSTFYRFHEVLLTLSMLVLTEITSERCKEYTFSDQTTA